MPAIATGFMRRTGTAPFLGGGPRSSAGGSRRPPASARVGWGEASPHETARQTSSRSTNPHFMPALVRRDRPFVSPPLGATTHTVWILLNPSSVIIPHLLSMRENYAASQQSANFRPLSRRRLASPHRRKRPSTHTHTLILVRRSGNEGSHRFESRGLGTHFQKAGEVPAMRQRNLSTFVLTSATAGSPAQSAEFPQGYYTYLHP